MKPKHQRLVFIFSSLLLFSVAIGLILWGLRDYVVYFFAPADLEKAQREFLVNNSDIQADLNKALPPQLQTRIRVGGMVADNSVLNETGDLLYFIVTDYDYSIAIKYQGLVPALFREGQGMVAEGYLEIAEGSDNVYLQNHQHAFDIYPQVFSNQPQNADIKRYILNADKLLAKHDENYMPPEVKDSLKK